MWHWYWCGIGTGVACYYNLFKMFKVRAQLSDFVRNLVKGLLQQVNINLKSKHINLQTNFFRFIRNESSL